MSASGLFVARFGGAHGHPTTSNPTAMYYNPAGLALDSGTRLLIDATLAHRTVSYERPSAAITNAGTGTPGDATLANSGKASLTNQASAPFLGIASDFGVDNLGVGFGLFAPVGGAATWDTNDEFNDHPLYSGASDGINRWWSIDGSLKLIYLTGSVAYRLPDAGLSFGLSVNGIAGSIHTIRARNADGSDDLVTAHPLTGEPQLKEGRSELKADGKFWSLGAGLTYEPSDGTVLGVSYQSAPNLSETVTFDGELRQVLALAAPGSQPVEFTSGFADIFRLGLSHKVSETVDVRAAADFARWSRLERQCVLDVLAADRRCELNADGSQPDGAGIIAAFERRWEDAFGVRLGGSYHLSESTETFIDLAYDASAVPAGFMDPALFDMEKYIVSVGGKLSLSESLELWATLTDVIYQETDTTGEFEPAGMSAPSKSPAAGGVFNQNIWVLNLTLQARL